jgi:hypothetical protein
VGGTHLGLFLRQRGVPATIYTDKAADQHLAARITNVVCRSGATRARERALTPPAHVVDMRLYWPRLLDEFTRRGGSLVHRTLTVDDMADLSARHDLVVVASGRTALSNLFPRLPEHSPFQSPQRLVTAALFRGIAYPTPLAFRRLSTPATARCSSSRSSRSNPA